MRPSQRQFDQLRDIEITTDISPYAEGSCLIKCGNTHIHCTASVETNLPPWRRGSGEGWITAEYGMLPRATGSRMRREATAGKQGGRTQEIQRLIGRSLRAAVDLKALGEAQIVVDCDVIRADGGTRTASITGGFVALYKAIEWMKEREMVETNPIIEPVAAISSGLYKGEAVLDLDYDEDSSAQADTNFVLTGSGKIIEIQGTAEEVPFERQQFNQLLDLAEKGVGELVQAQLNALGLDSWPQG